MGKTADYSNQAQRWARNEPIALADFVARPVVLENFKKIGKGKSSVDLGCGEGYFSRMMAIVSKSVIGIDNSEDMIRLAKEAERKSCLGIKYIVGDVTKVSEVIFPVDVAVGNFITNYLTPTELMQFYDSLSNILVPGGKFILSFPHPRNALSANIGPAYDFPTSRTFDYYKSRGKTFTGTLKTINGNDLEVSITHATFEDHEEGLEKAGLRILRIIEPELKKEIAEKYPLLKPALGQKIYVVLLGEKVLSLTVSASKSSI